MKAYLRYKDNGKGFILEEGITFIGRSRSNDLVIKDKFISRKHVMIQNDGDSFVLIGLGTVNSTIVNNKKIPPKYKYLLKQGDCVKIGETVFEFSLQKTELLVKMGSGSAQAQPNKVKDAIVVCSKARDNYIKSRSVLYKIKSRIKK